MKAALLFSLHLNICSQFEVNAGDILAFQPTSTARLCFYLLRREGWAICPSGHFLRELHRGESHELKSIKWATCCKPALHPHWYKQCYEQDVGQGMKCTRNGYYVVGIHRGASEKLSSINKLRCCNMYDSRYLFEAR